jgi:hypothetical protein
MERETGWKGTQEQEQRALLVARFARTCVLSGHPRSTWQRFFDEAGIITEKKRKRNSYSDTQRSKKKESSA